MARETLDLADSWRILDSFLSNIRLISIIITEKKGSSRVRIPVRFLTFSAFCIVQYIGQIKIIIIIITARKTDYNIFQINGIERNYLKL